MILNIFKVSTPCHAGGALSRVGRGNSVLKKKCHWIFAFLEN